MIPAKRPLGSDMIEKRLEIPANSREATLRVNDVQALPPIMTMDQVGKFLRLSRQKTYELAHRQDFPAVRFGRAIRVPRDALLKWLEAEARGKSRG